MGSIPTRVHLLSLPPLFGAYNLYFLSMSFLIPLVVGSVATIVILIKLGVYTDPTPPPVDGITSVDNLAQSELLKADVKTSTEGYETIEFQNLPKKAKPTFLETCSGYILFFLKFLNFTNKGDDQKGDDQKKNDQKGDDQKKNDQKGDVSRPQPAKDSSGKEDISTSMKVLRQFEREFEESPLFSPDIPTKYSEDNSFQYSALIKSEYRNITATIVHLRKMKKDSLFNFSKVQHNFFFRTKSVSGYYNLIKELKANPLQHKIAKENLDRMLLVYYRNVRLKEFFNYFGIMSVKRRWINVLKGHLVREKTNFIARLNKERLHEKPKLGLEDKFQLAIEKDSYLQQINTILYEGFILYRRELHLKARLDANSKDAANERDAAMGAAMDALMKATREKDTP